MNDRADLAQQTVDRFVDAVYAAGLVWGLLSDDGWAVCPAGEDEETDVYPFWSSEKSAAIHCVEEWSVFRPVSLTLEEFLEDWLPGMEEDEVMVGTDWDTELSGPEVEPSYLAEALTRH